MKYGISILFFMTICIVDCAKPVALRGIRNTDNKQNRSLNDYPANVKSGHCYVKATIPAEYKIVQEKVLVSTATSKLEQVPAETEMVEEKVIDIPSKSTWKKSVEGDFYCYDETPATYKIIKKEIVKAPATTKVVEVPPEYKTVETRELVRAERMDWTEILCGNNARPAVIEKIQKSLKKAGYSPGRDDGMLDEGTMEAINKYQKDHKLKKNRKGLINMEIVESLRVQF